MGYDVGSYAAPFCMDMDQDNDVDCLVGNSDGYVRYYENSPTTSSPYSFSQQFTNFFSVDVGSYAAPFCMDLDNDGKIDCLVGESGGYVQHFRRDAFQWTRVTTNFFSYDFGSYPVVFCADMDDDGLVDCLVGESSGQVFFMKRTGSSSSLTFSRQSQKYFGQLDFGSRAAPTCADMDGDGVLECFVGNSDGYISYMKKRANGDWVRESDNIFNYDFGSYAVPCAVDLDGDGAVDVVVGESGGYVRLMQRSSSVMFTYEGTILSDVGSNSVPNCVDMDKDGDVDVAVGDSNGYVEYFRNSGSSPNVQFTRVSTNYMGYSPDTYAAPSCFDTDGDGDIDCLVGTSNGNVHHYRRGSSSFSQVSNNYLAFDVGSYAVPYCVDMDGDGQVDCIVGANNGLVWYFKKNGASYTRVTTNFFGYDIGSYAAPACLDLGNDGRLDCLVGENGGQVYHFRNDGTNTSFDWKLVTANFFARDFGTRSTLSCSDIDGDGAIDCLVGESSGTVVHMRERPARGPIFTKEVANWFSDAGSYSRPHCTDLDDDGLIDCVVGNSDGYVQYYRNSGTAASPLSWSRQTTNFFSVDVGSYASPFCFDVDNDGDKDCLVGKDNGYVDLVRNDRFSWTRETSDYFSRDVGSYAAPFCIDMDNDGDLDCLVGTSAGTVYYFRRSGSSWTYVTSNLFGYDIGSYAVPFCADYDGDGDVDCILGENNGVMYEFRNDGTPTSYQWVLVTKNWLNMDTGTRNAPYCWDMDSDGDLDCVIGDSNGYVYTYKNHQSQNVSSQVASTSGAPLQQTTTTPTSGRPCPNGGYLSAGSCVQCAAGRYDTVTSSTSSTCAQCPQCTHSDAGSTSCKQLLSCWLQTVNGSTVTLSVDHNGGGLLHLRFTMPPLPAPTQLHGNHGLAYSADLQTAAASLSGNSTCGSLWTVGTDQIDVSMLYNELSTDCSVTQAVEATDVRFSGYAGLLVRAITDGNRVVRTVSFPFEIRFPREVASAYSMSAFAPVQMPWHSHHVAPYSSSLRAYTSSAFTSQVSVPIFQEGERIYIQQSASVGQAWTLSLVWVWISSSSDPADLGSVQANLTTTVTSHQANSDSVRFSFPATSCQDCYLHVVSLLNSRSRRLSASLITHFAHTTMVLQILAPTGKSTTEVRGFLDLAINDPAAFAADLHAMQGVAQGLRQLLGLPSDVHVSVVLEALASRLRRLQVAPSPTTSNVRATYSILLPLAGTGVRDPSSVQAALQSASATDVTQSIRSGLNNVTGGTGTYSVTVKAMSPPTLTQRAPSTGSEPRLVAPDEDNLSIYIAAGAGGAFLSFMGCLCLLLRQYRRTGRCPNPCRLCRRSKPGAPLVPPTPAPGGVVPPMPPVPPLIPAGPSGTLSARSKGSESDDFDMEVDNNADFRWALTMVRDAEVLGCLTELFTPPEETRKTLGVGRDSHRYHKRYSKLVVKHAWEVNMPMQKQYYETKRKDLRKQFRKIDKASPGVKRTGPMPTLTDSVGEKMGMDVGLNEKLLLHGTKVKLVEVILENGVDGRYTVVAAFGHGGYLAEDASKIDQYVEADTGPVEDDAIKHLHRVLYEASGVDRPEEVFYAFVCQVFIGCPIYTKGPSAPGHPTSVVGPTPSCEAGTPVFATEARLQLAAIPGTAPQIPYHSLVVEKGPDSVVKRHREFVLFDGKAILPKYLVAYTRE